MTLDISGLKHITGQGQFIPIAEAARKAGVPTPTLRKRLQRLDKKQGTKTLVKWGASKYGHHHVDLHALKDATEGLPSQEALEAMQAKLSLLERQLGALRKAYLELRHALVTQAA